MKKENKGMKSKKKSWLVLIVVVLMIAACGYVSAYGYGKDHIGTAKNNPPLPIRQSVSYLWYFIPALIVQAR